MTFLQKVRRHLIWARHKQRVARAADEHPLQYLFLEVTRVCNLACRYCGSSCSPKERANELTVPEWIEILRGIAKDFEPRKIMVAVTGGEPLLKDGIFDLFAELRRLGFPYGMVSNGQLLDRATAERLVAVGMGSVSLSMDALPELNDRLRGRGVSAGVQSAIVNLRAAGFRGKLEIISTITKPAVAGLEDMRRFVAALRVPLWRVAPVMPIGRALDHPELLPGPVEIRTILEFVRLSRRDAFVPRPEFSEEGFVGDRFEGEVRPYLCQCSAGTRIAGIRADGRIGACPELSPDFDQGDIRHDRLKDVWDTKYAVFRDRRWAKRGPCRSCGQWARCRGGAMHLYSKPGGDFLRCLYLMCKDTDGVPIARLKPTATAPARTNGLTSVGASSVTSDNAAVSSPNPFGPKP
jgi:radical SAM protein with 4Fe4S-binding SPASM domain